MTVQNEPVILRPQRLDVYRIAIPMRGFEHAAASRQEAQGIVIRVEFEGGLEGWGEALPRDYVTGETMDTVPVDLVGELWPQLARRAVELGPRGELTLPRRTADGRSVSSAAGALELAFWDAALRVNEDIVPDAGESPSIKSRVTGVLGSADPAKTAKRLRLMRWFGLCDFKLKLGLGDADAENLRLVHARLGGAIRRGRCTLRVDINGGWDIADVPRRTADLAQYGVCVVEQPTFCKADELAALAARCPLPLMADESLIDLADAKALLASGDKVWWNIRISKNGGPLASLALAELAAANGVPFTLGCMVGETGILSAAQRRLLQICPPPRFVEGNYGRFLLADDLTLPSPRFGYGGRLRCLRGDGLGVQVDGHRLQKYATLLTCAT